jgi:integrase
MRRRETDRINFTKRVLDAIRTPKVPKPTKANPRPKAKRVITYDTAVKGLGIVVQPITGSKSFFWFRKVAGVAKWETIGAYPDIAIEQARNFAQDKNSRLANWKATDYQGTDPFADRGDISFGKLVDDYIARHLKANAKSPGKAADYCRWQVDTYLSSWQDRKLISIRKEHCRALHAELGEEHPVTANRTLQLVRVLFNFAKREDLFAGENPAVGITPFREHSRVRFLQPDELKRLFEALDTRVTPRDLKDFVMLSLLCGARKSDTMSMRWDQLDLERGTWAIPNPKNQVPYIVPLVPEAVAIIQKRSKESEWIFPGVGASSHIVDLKRPWQTLLARAKLTDLRVHDLRRSLGSWMAGAGVSLPIIGKALGHQSGEATAIYARLSLDPVRKSIATATTAMLAAAAAKPKQKRRLLNA